jgi:hypothetical protein
MKQIYDKHEEIWWIQENVVERMTWNNFLKFQNIA